MVSGVASHPTVNQSIFIYGKLIFVLADRIVIKFPPKANHLGAAPLITLAERQKITPKTQQTAFSLLREISKIIAAATPPEQQTDSITLVVQCSTKRLAITVILPEHGSLTLSTARKLQKLHPSIMVKPARRKIGFELPSRLGLLALLLAPLA